MEWTCGGDEFDCRDVRPHPRHRARLRPVRRMTTPGGRRVTSTLCPFSIVVEPMAAMLNFELADDPTYAGAEVQRFDDTIHGVGMAVLLARRADGLVDVYRQAGLRLDPDSFGVGAGLGEWREAVIEPSFLEVSSTGVVVDVGLLDAAGRHVEMRADDRDDQMRTGPRSSPRSVPGHRAPHVDAHRLDAAVRPDADGREAGRDTVRGRDAATGQLPGARFHGRRLVKYRHGRRRCTSSTRRTTGRSPRWTLTTRPAWSWRDPRAAPGSRRLRRLPAVQCPARARSSVPGSRRDCADGAAANGTWRVAIDDEPSIVSGSWSARRTSERVDLSLVSTAPWRPGPLPMLMRIVTRIVPTFRRWPQTYRWHATLTLGDAPSLTSGWERSGGAGAEAYGRVMRVRSR